VTDREHTLRELAGTLLDRLGAMLDGGVDSLSVGTKEGAYDVVSDADRAIEAWLWERVHSEFPEDGFLGEEHGWRHGPTSHRDWIVDPIDGTVNFVTGLPWACSSVAVLDSGSAYAGLIVDPFRRDVYVTDTQSRTSELNGSPVRVAPGANLAGKVVLLEVPSGVSMTTLRAAARYVVDAGGAARSMGSGALSLALVAAGRAHAVVHAGPMIWDIAAGFALVQNAGGVVAGRQGPYVLDDGGPLVAGNADVCARLQAVVEGP
jgi:myo-inositol-1(or 4)-monophosphatase